MKLELFYPTDSIVITQLFGVNGKWYQDHNINTLGHNGIDFYVPHGAPVRAAHNGTIVYAGMDGNVVPIVLQQLSTKAGKIDYCFRTHDNVVATSDVPSKKYSYDISIPKDGGTRTSVPRV